MNSILINYTISNEKQILDGTENNFNISDILYKYSSKEKISGLFIEKLIKYFNNRKINVEQQNQVSNIYFQEEQIPCSFKFNIENLSKNTLLSGYNTSFHTFTMNDSNSQQLLETELKFPSGKNFNDSSIVGMYQSYYAKVKKSESGLHDILKAVEPEEQNYNKNDDFSDLEKEYVKENNVETDNLPW